MIHAKAPVAAAQVVRGRREELRPRGAGIGGEGYIQPPCGLQTEGTARIWRGQEKQAPGAPGGRGVDGASREARLKADGAPMLEEAERMRGWARQDVGSGARGVSCVGPREERGGPRPLPGYPSNRPVTLKGKARRGSGGGKRFGFGRAEGDGRRVRKC